MIFPARETSFQVGIGKCTEVECRDPYRFRSSMNLDLRPKWHSNCFSDCYVQSKFTRASHEVMLETFKIPIEER